MRDVSRGTTLLVPTGTSTINESVEDKGTTLLARTGCVDVIHYAPENTGTIAVTQTGTSHTVRYSEKTMVPCLVSSGEYDAVSRLDSVGTPVLVRSGRTDSLAYEDVNRPVVVFTIQNTFTQQTMQEPVSPVLVTTPTGLLDSQSNKEQTGMMVDAQTGGLGIPTTVIVSVATLIKVRTGAKDTLRRTKQNPVFVGTRTDSSETTGTRGGNGTSSGFRGGRSDDATTCGGRGGRFSGKRTDNGSSERPHKN